MAITYKTGKSEGLSVEINVRGAVTVRLQACLQLGLPNSSFEKVKVFLASFIFLD